MTTLEEQKTLIRTLSERPIAYMPVYARLAGSVTAGVMLSQAMYWTGKGQDDGWFWKTSDEWERETCLTYCEQRTARAALLKIGVMEEVRRGVPAKLWYRVKLDVLAELLLSHKSRVEESSNQEMANPQILSNENVQSNSYTTSDTTSNSRTEPNGSGGAPAPQPAPRISHADPRTSHPAIEAIRTVTGKRPPKAVYDAIITRLGDAPDVGKLTANYAAWCERGYNPQAFTWATEWYPGGPPQRNGNGNGRNASEPAGLASIRRVREKLQNGTT